MDKLNNSEKLVQFNNRLTSFYEYRILLANLKIKQLEDFPEQSAYHTKKLKKYYNKISNKYNKKIEKMQ
jgi:hypothetical protein